ncbi:MAG: GAF domain-containing protein [Elusimicrobiaceae bacterium]|uniref:GAF and HD-GYP domain-containing protein n=1 Tax=Candidatus Avelusimicrobium faecicola TaxID=3416205 RepID=UPI002A7B6C9F|nr:GAF domain-containing protein [Spirochaetota bacterium]MDY2939648.1 GAF domain-containing protein [Elusimicrobiaceae bacterium]
MQPFKTETSKLSAEEKLNLLVEFGTRISCEIRLDKLLDIIAQQITKMLNVGRCTIYLKDVEKNELWSKIAQGRGLEHTEIRVPLNGNGVISICARTGETINLPNAYEDPRFCMDVDMVTDFRTHTLLAVPLKNNSGRVLGVFQVANKSDGNPFDKKDEGILLLLATLASSAIEIAKLYQDVHVAQLETIYRLAVTAEYRDQQDTRAHLKNISIISYLLALALGMTRKEAELIKNASPLHDIGKVALADNILLKPGKLTPEEFEIMKSHTVYGGRILEGAHSKILQIAHKMSLYHHEKWNGLGYPKALQGEEIPIEARIVTVADVFDALCVFRVYKKAWKTDDAYEYILGEAGKSFDPRVVAAFKKIYPSIRKLYAPAAVYATAEERQHSSASDAAAAALAKQGQH